MVRCVLAGVVNLDLRLAEPRGYRNEKAAPFNGAASALSWSFFVSRLYAASRPTRPATSRL